MSTEPLPPVQPPAGPPPAVPPAAAAPASQAPAPAAAATPAPSTAPRRRVPSRGALIAALVVAVVLLVGSVGATVAFVHDRTTAGVSRFVGPNGRMFFLPGPGRDGRTYQLPENPKRPGMPMGPGRHYYAPGQKSPTPSPSPSAS